MFRWLGKINIATQLTLLLALVTGLAIFVVSQAAEGRSEQLILERSRSSLADECLLRGFDLREAVRSLTRQFRQLADELEKAGPQRSAKLKEIFKKLRDPHDEFSPEILFEVGMAELKSSGEVSIANIPETFFRQRNGEAEPSPRSRDQASNAAVEYLWNRLRKEAKEIGPSKQLDPRQQVSKLTVYRDGPLGNGQPTFLLAFSYALGNPAASLREVLFVTVDFTRLVRSQTRRLPRHLLFVSDPDGISIYHPDPTMIGEKQQERGLGKTKEGDDSDLKTQDMSPVPVRGRYIGEMKLEKLGYYSVRKPLQEAMSRDNKASTGLEEELLKLEGLRFSRLWQGANYLELSCRDRKVLQEAQARVDLAEAELKPPPTPWPKEILCKNFDGHFIEKMPLVPEEKLSVNLILAIAREEIKGEIHNAIASLWRTRLVPVLLTSAGLCLFAAYRLTRPLRRLIEASQRLAQGDYSGVDVKVVAAGEVGELTSAFRDMTAKIRTRERELLENSARMNIILKNAADGIITFDQSGTIEQANKAAGDMFGYPDGLEGIRVQKLMKLPEHLQKPMTLNSMLSTGGSSFPTSGGMTQLFDAVKTPGEEHRGLRKDGTTFWMEVTFSQVPLIDRRIITGIFRDVTQRKLDEERIRKMNDELDARVRLRTAQLEDANSKLELALVQAESASAAKDRFISVVSHELRTPLTSAMGYTELLLNPRATRLRENPGPTLEKILTSCKHLLTLINDLLDVGRYTAGKPIDLVPSRFELGEFLKGVQEMVSPLVKKNGNTLEMLLPAQPVQIYTDETRLRQIMLNLLSNAAKFTEKGRLTLKLERVGEADENLLQFQVCDTGPGMTAEQLDKLFTPFYRGDNSTSRRQGGTGLGLTITKMLCSLMGGSIRVESIPGKGSTFFVTLPVDLPSAGRKAVGDNGSVGEHHGTSEEGTVLVVDDDPTIRQLLDTFLSQEGYHVLQASSGSQGFRLAKENQPMCITLDVMMPGEDGWDVLARLKSDPATRDIPVIMLTIMEERNRGFALGATEYVTKPIDWARLGSILCRYNPEKAPILIVEDDALQRGYIREELLLAGWTVLEAANGAEALKVCDTITPSLILLDLSMPIMDGFTFMDEFRKREASNSIPVVILTARELSMEDRRRLNRSVAQVLAKETLSRDQLLKRVREQMRERFART